MFFLFDKQSFLALTPKKISRQSVSPSVRPSIGGGSVLKTVSKTKKDTHHKKNGVNLLGRVLFDEFLAAETSSPF